MAESKKAAKPVKVTANLKKAEIDSDNIDVDANGQVYLWGINFDVKKGVATAEIDPALAECMKDAKLVK